MAEPEGQIVAPSGERACTLLNSVRRALISLARQVNGLQSILRMKVQRCIGARIDLGIGVSQKQDGSGSTGNGLTVTVHSAFSNQLPASDVVVSGNRVV